MCTKQSAIEQDYPTFFSGLEASFKNGLIASELCLGEIGCIYSSNLGDVGVLCAHSELPTREG